MLGVEKSASSLSGVNMAAKPPSSFRLNRAKTSLKSKFKIPNEVERWALGQHNSKYQSNYDSDDFESIDDSYIRNLAVSDQSENDKKQQMSDKNREEEQRLRIREMISNLRRAKEIQKKLNKGYYGVLEQQANNEANTNATASSNQMNSASDSQKTIEDEEIQLIENGKAASKTSKKSGKDKKFQFRSLNNGMTRAVPGSLQQNITVERTFFKDLLDLSKQRYMFRLGADFKKRQFQVRQERKGLLVKVEKKEDTFEMPDFLSRASSTSSVARVKAVRKFKSSSAFGHRHRDEIDSDEQLGVKKTDRPNTTIKKDIPANDFIASLKPSFNDSESYTKIKISNDTNLTENASTLDFDAELSSRNLSPKKPLKPALKRPNTSNAVLSSFKATDESEFNDDYLISLKEKFKTRGNPTADTRYKSLVDSMNKVYLTNKETVISENKFEKPSERIRNLIRSNKALQGAGWNGDTEKEKKTRYELDSNKKLFEKAASDIF